MKRQTEQKTVQQFSLLIAGLVTFFSFFAAFSFSWLPFMLVLVFPFLLGAITYYAIYITTRLQPSVAIDRFAKGLSVIIVLSVIGSSWFAIQSLWVAPFNPGGDRFVLENIAATLLVIGGFSTLILSALQKDTFWFTKRRSGMLDEREMNERRVIFEKSYKYSIALTVVTLWGYLSTLDRLQTVRDIDVIRGTHLPGHYYFPAYCLLIAIIALPPVLATRKNK